MADPLSIALGVAPLCVGAIKGIKAAKARLKTLRQHNAELKTLRKKFTKETHIFLDECHLLLQEIVEPDDVVFMIEEVDNSLWSDPELNEEIKSYLGTRYDDFEETLQEIKDQISSLDSDLNSEFGRDVLKSQRKSSERMRDAFDVAFHKSKYESRIDNLKELNQDLKRLRKTAKQVQNAKPKQRDTREKTMPKTYQDLSYYSRSFFEALGHCWSCIRLEHVYHDLALFLHHSGDSLRFIFRRRAISGFKTISKSTVFRVVSQELSVHRSLCYPTPEPSVSSECSYEDSQPRKRLKLMVADSQTSSQLCRSIHSASTADAFNLSEIQDVCHTLGSEENTLVPPNEAPSYYVDAASNLRHSLHLEVSTHLSLVSLSGVPVPLEVLLTQPMDSHVSIMQQLRLALTLARGLLQFNSSRWWQTYWCFRDIYYFDVGDDLDASLETLHVRAEIQPQKDTKKGKQKATEAISTDLGLSEEAHLSFGVRNLALYSLGVALLQIDRWSLLKADDVVKIRKLSQQSSRLGPRYQDVVQRCIECDFGQGSDLEKTQLQNAVYGSVVCEIETLIGVLERKQA